MAITHAIFNLVPRELYEIKTGHTILAFFMYFCAFINGISMIIFDVKFFIIGYEQCIAFKLRETYEYSSDKRSLKALGYIVSFNTCYFVFLGSWYNNFYYWKSIVCVL